MVDASPRNTSDIVRCGIEKELLAARDETLPIELEQLKRKRDYLTDEIDELVDERESIETRIAEIQGVLDAVDPILEEAAEKLSEHQLDTDNPAVVNWASKAGISPRQLIECVREIHQEETDG